jgi:hypothetical protein
LLAGLLDGVRASGNRDVCVKTTPTKRGIMVLDQNDFSEDYNNNNNNNNYIYPGYPHHLRVFQWGPASKLQLFTILIVNI